MLAQASHPNYDARPSASIFTQRPSGSRFPHGFSGSDCLPHRQHPGAGPVESRKTNSGSITISWSATVFPDLESNVSEIRCPIVSRGMCTVVIGGGEQAENFTMR